MSSIGSLDKDIRRKILGPVLTEFSAEYMNARIAIRGGQDPKTYRFDRRWEVSNAGAVQLFSNTHYRRLWQKAKHQNGGRIRRQWT